MVLRREYVAGNEFVYDSDRYKFIKVLGKGAYGIVVQAQEIQTGRLVAIKRIGRIFHNLSDAKRILRELRLQKAFARDKLPPDGEPHENLLSTADIFIFEPEEEYAEIYVVSEFYHLDLHNLLKHHDINYELWRFMAFQMLRGLVYLHSGNIMHRDLKPQNILVTAETKLCIADFGLSRRQPDDMEGTMTEYVITRWYRSPEVLCMSSSGTYDTKCDMWSLGCILIELMTKQTLFPGNNTLNQVGRIINAMGTPSQEDVEAMNNVEFTRWISRQPVLPTKTIHQVVGQELPEPAAELLTALLQFNPAKRITAVDALKLPIFEDMFKAEEDLCEFQASYDDDFETQNLNMDDIRKLLYAERTEDYV